VRPLLAPALLLLAALAPAQTPQKPGAKAFDAYCTACHQYDAQGMGEAPPLHDSDWVEGPQDRLIRIVMHGVRGAIEVQGKTYNREMPGFGAILDDKQIAELLTFVRDTFGGGSPAISEAAVRRIRERHKDRRAYWTVEELTALAEPRP